MTKILQYSKGKFHRIKNIDSFIGKNKPPRNQTWIDISGLDNKDLDKIGRLYRLHPLAIEDCKTPFHFPKIDYYPDCIFLTFQSLKGNHNNTNQINWQEIDIFFSKNYLITFHLEEISIVDRLFSHMENDQKQDIGDIFYHIIDNIVDNYMPYLDQLSDEIDDLEENIIGDFDKKFSERIINLRRKMLSMRKIISPERNVILELVERSQEYYAKDMRAYYMDIYDHIFHIIETVDTYRDILAGTMELYLSSISNRMNEIMKVLTIIATIILPLTLITGIYGMNFRNMPEIYWKYGYPAVLFFMLLIIFGMVYFFKRKNWF